MPPTDSPVRPKVVIKSNDGGTTYHTYDAFDVASADINISTVHTTIGLGQAGYFTIAIEDSDGNLNANVGNGSKIVIQAAKTQGALANLLTGYVRHKTTLRDQTNTLGYILTGYGAQIRFNERITNFYRIANRDSFGSADPASDTNMQGDELMKDLVDDSDHLPIGTPLESFTVTGVDSGITEQLPSIKEPYVEFSHVANMINDALGTIWGVDASEDVFMRYPTSSHSGITITDNPQTTDGANYAYPVGKWSFDDTIEKADGFSNRLYGRGGTNFFVDKSQTTNSSQSTLYDTDRAQAFTPETHKLDSISLILSKVGSISGAIQGEIRLDDSGPTGDLIASFEIFEELVGTSATTINRIPLNIRRSNVQVDKKHWIILKEYGADASNTVRWHHDNGSSGNSASRSPGGSGAWTVTSSGNAFCFVTYGSRQVLNEASSSTSITSYGVIESVIDAPWIIEGRTMDKYLTAILESSAKQKRIYDIPKVKAPDALFVPGKMVNIIDSKANLMTQAELLQATYHFDAYTQGLGTSYVTGLKLVTYVP